MIIQVSLTIVLLFFLVAFSLYLYCVHKYYGFLKRQAKQGEKIIKKHKERKGITYD